MFRETGEADLVNSPPLVRLMASEASVIQLIVPEIHVVRLTPGITRPPPLRRLPYNWTAPSSCPGLISPISSGFRSRKGFSRSNRPDFVFSPPVLPIPPVYSSCSRETLMNQKKPRRSVLTYTRLGPFVLGTSENLPLHQHHKLGNRYQGNQVDSARP